MSYVSKALRISVKTTIFTGANLRTSVIIRIYTFPANTYQSLPQCWFAHPCQSLETKLKNQHTTFLKSSERWVHNMVEKLKTEQLPIMLSCVFQLCNSLDMKNNQKSFNLKKEFTIFQSST